MAGAGRRVARCCSVGVDGGVVYPAPEGQGGSDSPAEYPRHAGGKQSVDARRDRQPEARAAEFAPDRAVDLAEALETAGWNVAAYTGRTEAEERERLEQALIHNELKALVATSALGMGFDKPDLGFVVHMGAPGSPVSYYQQIGRAGRATDHAEVMLLPGPEDERVWEYFTSVSMPEEPVVQQLLGALGDDPVSTPKLENAVDLSRTRIDQALKVLDVDGAVTRVKGGWVSTGSPWAYDHERYDGLAGAREREQGLMLAYETTDACRMVFLRRELDDPTIGEGERCGRCDNCTGDHLSADVDPALVERIVDDALDAFEASGSPT